MVAKSRVLCSIRSRMKEEMVIAYYGLPPNYAEIIGKKRRNRLLSLQGTVDAIQGRTSLTEPQLRAKSDLKGLIAEIKFVCAWSTDDFEQPGFESVRFGTPAEDYLLVDAVMTLTNGVKVPIQIKSYDCPYFAFLRYLRSGVVLVTVDCMAPLAEIRHATLKALWEANQRIESGEVEYKPWR